MRFVFAAARRTSGKERRKSEGWSCEREGEETSGVSRRKLRKPGRCGKGKTERPLFFLKRSVTVNGDAVAAVRAEKHVVPARDEPGKRCVRPGRNAVFPVVFRRAGALRYAVRSGGPGGEAVGNPVRSGRRSIAVPGHRSRERRNLRAVRLRESDADGRFGFESL